MPRTVPGRMPGGTEIHCIVQPDPPKRPVGALRHGLFTKTLHFDALGEARAYARLRRELRREFKPQNISEETLIEKMSVALWKTRRAYGAESGEVEISERARARLVALDREFHRAHEALRRVKGMQVARLRAYRDWELSQWQMERAERER